MAIYIPLKVNIRLYILKSVFGCLFQGQYLGLYSFSDQYMAVYLKASIVVLNLDLIKGINLKVTIYSNVNFFIRFFFQLRNVTFHVVETKKKCYFPIIRWNPRPSYSRRYSWRPRPRRYCRSSWVGRARACRWARRSCPPAINTSSRSSRLGSKCSVSSHTSGLGWVYTTDFMI